MIVIANVSVEFSKVEQHAGPRRKTAVPPPHSGSQIRIASSLALALRQTDVLLSFKIYAGKLADDD
ncbi:hypothetical protein GJ744_012439 [Endocarpon pusillum]|uniref:Uncharacterized protein n=1 Tax=Endocarpon pusillum TaxID=364733 RepID=A0A8H7AD71_9EURO|nr:hypothetical protein GJ744_012439 [Endocarpon pusillum]